MTKLSAFQMMLRDIGNLGMYITTHHEKLPHPDSASFASVLKEVVMQYVAILLQADPMFKKAIYGYVSTYYPYTLEASLRQFYRHEKTIRTRMESNAPEHRHLYDPADFVALQNRVERTAPLVEAVLRKKIHLSKNVSDSTFAKIYADYDLEYQHQAKDYLNNDHEYVFSAVHFYRLEHAFAFSLIANIAEYMVARDVRQFNFQGFFSLITDVAVPDLEEPQARSFSAWPNLLIVQQHIPEIFYEDDLSLALLADFGSRMLKQNILERLPPPEKYGAFDLSEVAAFIRMNAPFIETHKPVSFYLDKETENVDKPKVKLARMLMRQFYGFIP